MQEHISPLVRHVLFALVCIVFHLILAHLRSLFTIYKQITNDGNVYNKIDTNSQCIHLEPSWASKHRKREWSGSARKTSNGETDGESVMRSVSASLIAAFVDIHNGFGVCIIRFDDARETHSNAPRAGQKGVDSFVIISSDEFGCSRCNRDDHFTLLARFELLSKCAVSRFESERLEWQI